jgi:hypothetical protein
LGRRLQFRIQAMQPDPHGGRDFAVARARQRLNCNGVFRSGTGILPVCFKNKSFRRKNSKT